MNNNNNTPTFFIFHIWEKILRRRFVCFFSSKKLLLLDTGNWHTRRYTFGKWFFRTGNVAEPSRMPSSAPGLYVATRLGRETSETARPPHAREKERGVSFRGRAVAEDARWAVSKYRGWKGDDAYVVLFLGARAGRFTRPRTIHRTGIRKSADTYNLL